jgi:Dihydrofolate reductase
MMNSLVQQIAIIVALDEGNAIGRDGGLLCHLPNDLKHFKRVTNGHTVIMGRKTFESLPEGALPNRTNIVVTSDAAENYPGCIVVRSVEEAFTHCTDDKKVFIIGGGQLYRSTIQFTDILYLTRIHHTFDDADTFFPEINFNEWVLIEKEEHTADEKHLYDYSFLTYEKK